MAEKWRIITIVKNGQNGWKNFKKKLFQVVPINRKTRDYFFINPLLINKSIVWIYPINRMRCVMCTAPKRTNVATMSAWIQYTQRRDDQMRSEQGTTFVLRSTEFSFEWIKRDSTQITQKSLLLHISFAKKSNRKTNV